MKQEIWIYVDCPREKLIEWLRLLIGPFKEDVKIGDTITFYSSKHGFLLIRSNDEDSWLEVGLHSPPS